MRLPNNYGSITKYNDHPRRNPYIVRFKGKYIGAAETYEGALEMLAEYHKNPLEEKTMTFSELWELWLEQKSGTLSPHTVKNYKSKYRNYCQPLYDKEYKSLRPKDYLQIISLHPETTNGTKNNIIKFLHAMDRFAYELDLIDKKYTENLQMYRNEEKRKNVVFSDEEIDYLWEHPELKDSDLVLILLYTGLRPGELCEVKLENIYLEGESPYMIAGFKTKAGTDRYIPIHPRIKKLIESRIQAAKHDTLLNYQYKSLGVHFRKLMKKLGWTHHLHECRHTFITRLDNAGANQICIQLIVGHAQSSVTGKVYTHKTEEQLQETVRLLC